MFFDKGIFELGLLMLNCGDMPNNCLDRLVLVEGLGGNLISRVSIACEYDTGLKEEIEGYVVLYFYLPTGYVKEFVQS